MIEADELKEVLKEEKIFHLLRALHQLLHLYDINQKFTPNPRGMMDISKLKDSVSMVLKDKEGNIKTQK